MMLATIHGVAASFPDSTRSSVGINSCQITCPVTELLNENWGLPSSVTMCQQLLRQVEGPLLGDNGSM